MGNALVIGILLVGALLALILWGKAKGNPDPKSMTSDSINARISSEQKWVDRYLSLPMSNQAGEEINKQYKEKKIYILELRLELLMRQIVHTGQPEEQTMAPSFRKIIELMKSGMAEDKAVAQVKKELEESESA